MTMFCGTPAANPTADPFRAFLRGMLCDARFRALVERGILPADPTLLTPETTVLRLAMALTDQLDRPGVHPALLTLDELDSLEAKR